jgi:hypothetical protein
MKDDGLAHQPYYNTGSIEPIDVVEDWGFAKGFNRGNAIKYIARAGIKDPATERKDLGKALWYLQRELNRLDKLAGDTNDLKR